MNDHEQIEIIQAHMAGKKVLCCDWQPDAPSHQWLEVAKGTYHFNFQRYQYRIEPRKVECFCYLAQGQIDALLRDKPASVETVIGNGAALALDHELPTPKLVVKLTFLEPV
jgi:hypothetical protein